MYVIHEQKQKSNVLIILIYFLLAVLLLISIFFKDLPRISKIVLTVVLLVDLILLKSFYYLVFRVTSDGLEFGYGFLKNKVAKNNIKSVLIDDSHGNFFGYGIRFNKYKVLGFIAQSGPGLMISLKDGRSFFTTLDKPEEALAIIKENNYLPD